jgi:transcriptional regulator with XRE-family HTH domain
MEKKNMSTDQVNFTQRYEDNEILSQSILDPDKELQLFKSIRRRLREIRKELKLTQREFGESSGIDRRYIAKVECGSQNPSFKFMRSISIKHKISLDWLLYGVGNKFVQATPENYGEELFIFKKLLDKGSKEDIEVIIKMIKKIIT